ncbi:hypothetical protein N9T38_01580 [SAR116 cluster bacterium]|nr:hypothetical protein [SAR116 cluster bacterium]
MVELGQSASSQQKEEGGSKAEPNPMQSIARCLACGQPENIIWVHGHGQCAHCHMNVMPCCDGEVCAPDPGDPKDRVSWNK